MVRALSSTSGMKQSPVFMRAPTTSMPGSSAPSRISRALLPCASSAGVRAVMRSPLPSITAFFICSNSGSGTTGSASLDAPLLVGRLHEGAHLFDDVGVERLRPVVLDDLARRGERAGVQVGARRRSATPRARAGRAAWAATARACAGRCCRGSGSRRTRPTLWISSTMSSSSSTQMPLTTNLIICANSLSITSCAQSKVTPDSIIPAP